MNFFLDHFRDDRQQVVTSKLCAQSTELNKKIREIILKHSLYYIHYTGVHGTYDHKISKNENPIA